MGCAEGVLIVRDHGRGVADTDIEHIFDRFYRAPEARSRPGSGLGLAIVAQVAVDEGGHGERRTTPPEAARCSASPSRRSPAPPRRVPPSTDWPARGVRPDPGPYGVKRPARLGCRTDMGSLIKKRRKRMRKKKHKKMLKATRWQRRAAGK